MDTTPQYQDKILVCRDCQKDFTWTSGEQQFYATHQFTPPLRCKPCRMEKKRRMANYHDNRGNGGNVVQ